MCVLHAAPNNEIVRHLILNKNFIKNTISPSSFTYSYYKNNILKFLKVFSMKISSNVNFSNSIETTNNDSRDIQATIHSRKRYEITFVFLNQTAEFFLRSDQSEHKCKKENATCAVARDRRGIGKEIRKPSCWSGRNPGHEDAGP